MSEYVVEIPVRKDDGIWFTEAWFSGETEGVGSVSVSRALGAPIVEVSVKMEDGRKGRYVLDVEAAVREIVKRDFPTLEGGGS